MGLKVIITGTTGMVGEGVLLVCLNHPSVEKVLIINRRTAGITHPKLTEILHPDFTNLAPVAGQLTGYDACYHCMGISSVGTSKENYYKVTYLMSMELGRTLSRLNPEMVFCYVSGAGTDETGTAKMEWARLKGRTENELAQLPFKKMYAYRPGFIKPIPGSKHAHTFYNYINWIFPAGKKLYPNGFNTMEELGLSMINLSLHPADINILNGKDIARHAEL